MVQLLIGRVTGDDSKSPWADPDPQVFLKVLRYMERPDSTASHFTSGDSSSLVESRPAALGGS